MENVFDTLVNFEYIDFFIGIFIVYNAFLGWKSGYLRQLINLILLSVAIHFSFRYSFQFGNYISNWFNSDIVFSEIFAGILIFSSQITIFSLILNLFKVREPEFEIGNKFSGILISLLVSNLVLTILFSSITLLNLPNTIKKEINESNLTSFYLNVDGTPQQFLELISGTDILKVSQRIKEITGSSTVVVDEFGCVEIPKYPLQSIFFDNDLSNQMAQILNEERVINNLLPLEFNQSISLVAKAYAIEMYTKGFWCHKNPENGEFASDRLDNAGIPYQLIGENLAITPTLQSGHRSLMSSNSHRGTILDPNYKRLGLAVVSGPLGLIIVQIFSS